MVKVMVVVQRKLGLTREEFLAHWGEAHPAFVERLPGIRGYRQNVSIEHRTTWPFDGIAELYFDSVKGCCDCIRGARSEVVVCARA